MADDFYALIMAGGGGTRLWPLSRRTRPKQMLRLVGDRTLFQLAVDRLLPIFPAEHIIVVTVEEQFDTLRRQVPELPESSFMIEPEARGTASVIGLGATVLRDRYGECVMACLPADHHIGDENRFRECLLAAYEVAANDYLVTMGIPPTHPATGYGYIQRGAPLGDDHGFKAYEVQEFKEKPSRPVAEAYLASKDYYWNSGMFVWKVGRILKEIDLRMAGLHDGLGRISMSLGTPAQDKTLRAVWRKLDVQTIDYGIMEKAEGVAVIAADGLDWCDIGGWTGLWDVVPEDATGNIIVAKNVLAIDSKGSLVFQDSGKEAGRMIAMLGVTGMIIVDTGDALLVCPRDRAEDVRQIVAKLENENMRDLL